MDKESYRMLQVSILEHFNMVNVMDKVHFVLHHLYMKESGNIIYNKGMVQKNFKMEQYIKENI